MILVYVITVAILAAAAVFYKRMDSKFKQEIADQKAVITALQVHVEALSKKRDQLVRDLRNSNSAIATKASEFPVSATIADTTAPAKKKKVYKRKPKAKVAE